MDIYDFLIEVKNAGTYVEKVHAGKEISFKELPGYLNRHVLLKCLYNDTDIYKVIFVKNVILKYGKKWLVYRDGTSIDCLMPAWSFNKKREYHHEIFECI